VGKSGGCMSAWSESLGRMISIAMRAGVDVKSIVKQLTGIRCSFPTWKDGKQIFSCADAIGKAIEEYRYVNEDFAVEMLELTSHMNDGRDDPPECPECGGTLTIGEGCMKCESCGYTKCG
jgi:ribonucleoside-diphosphate reductase alpha chain